MAEGLSQLLRIVHLVIHTRHLINLLRLNPTDRTATMRILPVVLRRLAIH